MQSCFPRFRFAPTRLSIPPPRASTGITASPIPNLQITLNIADSLNITETVFSFALVCGWFFLGKELFVRGQPTFGLLIAVGAAMVLAADTMRVLIEGQPGPDVLMMIQGIGITGKLMILWSLFRGRHHLLP